jgi:alpha-L-rhamnosidase
MDRLIRVFVVGVVFLAGSCAAGVLVDKLRCEYLVEPLGIDVTRPRLSWIMNSTRRGERQTSYQILVASAQQALEKNQGDLWDSGKVVSDETAQIAYEGISLASRQSCWWKVRIWDRDGIPTEWSSVAYWQMGLLRPDDWSAKWIMSETEASTPNARLVVRHATYGAADGGGGADVTAVLTNHTEDSHPVTAANNNNLGMDPASVPYMRKVFVPSRSVRRAVLYTAALGLYEIHINGERVGDHVLAPDWTDYRKRVRYQTYDVTKLLTHGSNAIAVMLANGWYSGHIGNGGNQFFGKSPAFLAQLEIAYQDGSGERIVSDHSWKHHPGPALSSDFMVGEDYDARLEVKDWDKPGAEDGDWVAATTRSAPAIALDAQVMEPVRQVCELKPKAVTEPKPGCWVYDLGQNMVGVVRLKVSAPVGTRVTLRHAEMLNADGTLYTKNLRGAPSTDHYTCKGGGPEIWQPRFTFHGFRYVEITGLPANPGTDAVTGVVIGSDAAQAGEFTCSDSRLNQLQSNIRWGQRGNYLSVPTDCPQRDERLGWMGDAQVFIRTATYNADVAAFFTKWLVDVDDGQTSAGAFSDVSPNTMGWNGVPGWGDAGVICPWTIYQVYGDRRVLENHLPAMIKWVEYLRLHSRDLIREKDRGHDYGDWLSIGADTPKDLIGTAYFAYSTHIVAQACHVLGRSEESAKYDRLFQDIKAAFDKRYLAADGRIAGNTQCAYAMALKFDLLPDGLRSKAAQYLADDIRARKGHLSTGFLGVSYLLPVLTESGHADAAYQLLFQDSFPSWLFSVKQGATTIWERWDGWTPEKGFQDPGMNSFNHYSLGSCGEFLFGYVGGIRAASPGFKTILIAPVICNQLTWAKTTYDSIHGKIATFWERNGYGLALEATIPANTSATICLPEKDAGAVTESGRPVGEVAAVKFLRSEDGKVLFAVGSGTYKFACEMAQTGY